MDNKTGGMTANDRGAHTPGPWAVCDRYSAAIVPLSEAHKSIGASTNPEEDAARFSTVIAIVDAKPRRTTRKERIANARLIAAAPELLHELRSLAELAHNVIDVPDSVWAAIAKATGARPIRPLLRAEGAAAMTAKVPLVCERTGDWFRRFTKPVSSSLPFYEREGFGYVHRVRSSHLHYDDNGRLTHTSVRFWCGSHGFLYPPGRKCRKHAPAAMRSRPSDGRVVCAACEGKAIGSGQTGAGKIGRNFVKFKPHSPFFGGKPRGVAP